MIEPGQFSEHEAWVVFRLNDAPVCTQSDGDFNVFCLMDAATGFIMGSEFVSTQSATLPKMTAERLLFAGKSRAKGQARTMLVAAEQEAEHLIVLARISGIEVVRVPDDQLLPFVSEAREGFQAHVGGGKVQ